MKHNKTEILKGLVIYGSHNIITVRIEKDGVVSDLECRIKGKILKNSETYYNPFAPGDIVTVEYGEKSAMILDVEKRRNLFTRYNIKRSASQLIAANIDLVLCLCTPASPPFRPRFVDRVLLQADYSGIESIIILNKIDLESNIDVDERLEDFIHIGYKVLRVSAKTGEGIDELRKTINGKTSVLIGQSGTGKSSLINTLNPGLNIREGALSEKYNRGNHTTTMSFLIEMPGGTRIIDTPGVRQFISDIREKNEIITNMREFVPLAGKCSFGLSCTHRTEPGCKIMEAVNAGIIHEDRYESFLRICDTVDGIYKDDY